MKKRLMILATLFCVAFAVTGCGGSGKDEDKKEKTETTKDDGKGTDDAEAPVDEIDKIPVTDKTVEEEGIDKFVKPGEYKGLELEKTIFKVTDEEVAETIKTALSQGAKEVEGATVQDGDTANIDYVGKVGGETFEGGSAEGFDLTIGSGRFIEGFEAGLVGVKVGETKDLNLKFPEQYDEKLAGKDVVFTVTVNNVKRPLAEPTDEWVTSNTEYKTVDEYKAGVRKGLEESYNEQSQQALEGTAWQTIVSESEVMQLPKAEIDAEAANYKKQVEATAKNYGMEFDAFLEAQGMTKENFELQCQQYGKNMTKQSLILRSIAEKEGYTKEDEDYKTMLDEIVKGSGFESVEAMIESGISESDIHNTVMIRKVLNFVVSKAKIKEVDNTTQAEGAAESSTN